MGAFKRYSISCVCCIIFSFTACSQSIRINGEFNNIKFPQFVKQVEAGTIYHFYYDEAALDSFTVNIKLDNQTIADALQQIFKNTAFRYSIDADARMPDGRGPAGAVYDLDWIQHQRQ